MLRSLLILLIIGISQGDPRGARVRRIVGGQPADLPPEDDPTVYVRFAGKSAQIQGVRDHPHYVFRGIRYAHPPTGANRFLRPQEYFLEGFQNATQYPPPCIQPGIGGGRQNTPPSSLTIVGNEDCLFLNVFTPVLPTGLEGLPVVVWIHGGGFRYGSASQYGVRHLVGKQIIVVTIQYRLGSLGFLSANAKELPGNAALWDMVLAVQWVRNYIGFFGGNPHRIVVMGHESGASSAMLVSLSNVAKGMISGIVAMSGSSVSYGAVDGSGSNTARHVAELNGCPLGSVITMIRCLQNLAPAAIIKGDSHIEFQRLQQQDFVSDISGRMYSSPVSEGRYDGRSLPVLIEREPLADLEDSKNDNPLARIPLLIGITDDETKKACDGRYRNEIVQKLTTVPNYLDNFLIGSLQKKIIGLSGVGVDHDSTPSLSTKLSRGSNKMLDPFEFRKYIEVVRNDVHEALAKISEASTDALFNVPAFQTADIWSRHNASSFLYRFGHNGKRRKGRHFLPSSALVGNSSTDGSTAVSHGDELSYIFDAYDLHGNSLINHHQEEDENEDDRKVGDLFTQMIADFVRFGHVMVNNGGDKAPPFSNTNNNYIRIKAPNQLTLAKNFRYCQMALWCGLAQRLQSKTCSFVKVLDSQLKNVQLFLDSAGGSIGMNGTVNTGWNSSMAVKPPSLLSPPSLMVNKPLDIFKMGGGRVGTTGRSSSNNNKTKSLLNLGFI